MGSSLLTAQTKDILSLHVCGKLRVCDIQALSHTCRALRRLVAHDLPASVWQKIAADALPAGSPILALPGSSVQDYLERVARAKVLLPEPAVLGEPTLPRGARSCLLYAWMHLGAWMILLSQK